MTYTVVIPTMSYSKIFQLCLESLVNSDYPGKIIVVEEGNSHREICKDYLPKHITYIKSTDFLGPDNLVELALDKTKSKYIIYSHNDVIFFPTWFSELEASMKEIPEQYFGMLGLNYDQIVVNHDPESVEDIRANANRVFQTHLYGQSNIGLANDLWSSNRVARMSVVAAFLRKDINSVRPLVTGVGIDWELHYKYAQEGKFNLHTKLSQPILHINREYGFGTDTQQYKQKYLDLRQTSYTQFIDKYGIDVNAFFDSYFGEAQFENRQAISEFLDDRDFQSAQALLEIYVGN